MANKIYNIENPVFVTDDRPGCYRVVNIKDIINLRITLVQHIEVKMSNPQGAPDTMGNEPRQDPFDGRGYITVPGQNRKARDAMQEIFGCNLYMEHGANLADKRRQVMAKLGIEAAAEETEEEAQADEAPDSKKGKGKKNGKKKVDKYGLTDADRDAVVKEMSEFYAGDFPMWAGVLTAPINRAVRGAVQSTFMQSVFRVNLLRMSLTNGAVANDDEKKQKDQTMGSITVVRHGVYRGRTTVHAPGAKRTFMTFEHANRLIEAKRIGWELAQSTLRPDIHNLRLDIFVHDSPYGSCRDDLIDKLTTPKLVGDLAMEADPEPLSLADYDMEFDMSGLPASVKHFVRQ